MFDPMRIAEFSTVSRIDPAPPTPEAIGRIYATLNDCLTQLDDMHVHLAAAHLSACLDVLTRDFNPD